jgi:hypothetical protein
MPLATSTGEKLKTLRDPIEENTLPRVLIRGGPIEPLRRICLCQETMTSQDVYSSAKSAGAWAMDALNRLQVKFVFAVMMPLHQVSVP